MAISPRLRNFLLISLIMLVAIFFRFYKLDSIPPGLYPDVAINGNNALQTLQTGDFKVFYPDNNGREGLIMWLDAISILVFGVTATALKIPAAIIGTLTVLGIYLLCRQMFAKNGNTIGLLAAFFCAVLFWHVNFSRIGFRAIMVPFFIVFSLYFIWKAFKSAEARPLRIRRGLASAALSGIFFGLGFYTYISFRLAVFLLFCVLVLWLIYLRNGKKFFYKISAIMLLTIFFVALPIGIYFLQNPADFFGRAGQTSVLSAQNPVAALGLSLAAHLGMFNFYGDQNWRHNYPVQPELFLPVGILFLIGLAISIRKLVKSPSDQADKIGYWTMLLWFGFLLLPGVFTIEAIPHALRTIGVIPPVVIMSAIGAVAVYGWLKPRISKSALITLAALFIFATAGSGYYEYFVAWANNQNVDGAFTKRFVDIADLASGLPKDYSVIVLANEDGVPVPFPDGIPAPAQTTMYAEIANCCSGKFAERYRPYPALIRPTVKRTAEFCTANESRSKYLKTDQLAPIAIDKTAIIPMKDEQTIFDNLTTLYPQGRIKTQNNIRYYEINQ